MASGTSPGTDGLAPLGGIASEGDGGRTWRKAPVLLYIAVLTAILAVTIVAATGFGAVHISPSEVLSSVAHHLGLGAAPEGRVPADAIVWDLRLPRILMAALCGMGLAGVGVVMQGVTRNPLADPYLLGLSSGASFGAVLVVAFGLGTIGSPSLTIGAFLGSAGAFMLVLILASGDGRLPPVRTVLAGIAIGETMTAATSFVTISSTNAQATRSLLVWLLGGFAGTQWSDLPLVAVLTIGFVIAGRRNARVLDGLALGDDTAETLGIPVVQARRVLLFSCALLTAVLVAMNGAIGFVGLVIPHLVRPIVGARHARVLPVAMLTGAIFLVIVDAVARTAFAPQEIPVGVITALVGAPFFAWQIRRQGE